MVEMIVVIIIVGASLFYTGYRIYKTVKRPNECSCESNNCKGCEVYKKIIQK